MTLTSSSQPTLADLYRRAHTLATADTAQPGLTAELHQAVATVLAPVATGPPLPPDEARLEAIRERIRRIAIVALRRQALVIRQDWADERVSVTGDDSSAPAPLVQAVTFGEAALHLHRAGDPARESTEQIVAFLRATLTIAGAAPAVAQAKRTEPPPEGAVFVAGEPPLDPGAPSESKTLDTRRRPVARRAIVIPALGSIAVAAFVVGFVIAPRIWGGREARPSAIRITRPAVMPSSPAAPLAVGPSVGSATTPMGAGPAPVTSAGSAQAPPRVAGTERGVVAPIARGRVAVVLRSEPSGAQVFIAGVWQGATPLTLEQPAGATVRLTVRRGTRVWRGLLQVGTRSGQVLTVRLPDSGLVTARSTPPPPSPTPAATPDAIATVSSGRAHYEAIMTQGVELYRGGWFGPAMARFRAASAVRPDAPSPYLWYARAALKVGRPEEARRALQHVLALAAPGSPAAVEAQALLNRLKP